MNGKGSKPRENADFKAYWENYDKIFRKKCEVCDGTGIVTGSDCEPWNPAQEKCKWCNGTGLYGCP
jgi:DnaJ-class molecular chaperone